MLQHSLLGHMHQIFLLVGAGLAVPEGETAKIKTLHEKIHGDSQPSPACLAEDLSGQQAAQWQGHREHAHGFPGGHVP